MYIELKNINKIFKGSNRANDFQALKDINLNIEKGEMLAIKGSSGAGKSTLLHIIGCLDKQTSGTYILNGQDISKLNTTQLAKLRNKSFGFVTQHFALVDDDNALQNVGAPLLFSKTPYRMIDHIAYDKLKKLSIDHLAKKRVAKFSGGEKQRVAIARALVCEPDIILADEPTGALDRKNAENVVNILKELNAEGKTIIIVTHDDFLASNCKRIIHILDGKMVEEK